jgi:ribosomal protein S18 acetylase RimI-like enzyme
MVWWEHGKITPIKSDFLNKVFMAAILSSIKPPKNKKLRPFDIRRDMKAVADLVEMCFAGTLDPDGERYLRQMRASAGDKLFTRWASCAADRISMPLSGFVWEEEGRLVGNLSLVPFFNWRRRIYMIANVAVHPDHRRKGIARALGEAALEHVERHRVESVWLQVRDDNPAAFDLYQNIGFKVRAHRTTWVAESRNQSEKRSASVNSLLPDGVHISFRKTRHWQRQQKWLELNYPPELHWQLPMKMMAMGPGFVSNIYRLLSDTQMHHWSAQKENHLLGVATWQPSRTYADHLWLAAPPQGEAQAIRALVPHLRKHQPSHRPLGLDYPQGRATKSLQEVGFHIQHTLIWMEMRL